MVLRVHPSRLHTRPRSARHHGSAVVAGDREEIQRVILTLRAPCARFACTGLLPGKSPVQAAQMIPASAGRT
jgi:hypothetical protein